MKQIWILMGIVGAGKSTRAKKIAEKNNAEIFSSDNLRKEYILKGVIPEKYDSKYNSMIFGEFHRRIHKALQNGQNVVVDSTNIPANNRKPIIDMAKEEGYKINGEVLLLEDDECKKRIEYREKSQPDCHKINNIEQTIQIYKERLQNGMPNLEEGFHEITIFNDGNIIENRKRILIATSNAGKVSIYGQVFKELGLPFCSLKDISIDTNIEENGKDEIENALIKARAYHEISGLPVIANDSGLIIDRLSSDKQPGLFVRRNNGKELSDEELLEVYIKLIEEVGGESEGHYNVGLAIIDIDGIEHCQMFKPTRHFISKPSKILKKGVPLSSLCFDKKTDKYMSEMTPEERNQYEGKEFKKQAEFIKSTFIG